MIPNIPPNLYPTTWLLIDYTKQYHIVHILYTFLLTYIKIYIYLCTLMCLYITITILLWVLSIYPFIKHYTIVISIITIQFSHNIIDLYSTYVELLSVYDLSKIYLISSWSNVQPLFDDVHAQIVQWINTFMSVNITHAPHQSLINKKKSLVTKFAFYQLHSIGLCG